MDLTTGSQIRIRRFNAQGGLHFDKVGRVLERDGRWFRFQDENGRRAWLDADPTAIGRTMTGWRQTYEVL
ncbi:hypothetical protein ACGF1Z_31265 [Streptomyces sp. NPDC048018]|uniref:hypothetical protein n=1 Tax=Streptomyces sp. NPDC048018 TaxID=3365499 RepID=UPI0037224F52